MGKKSITIENDNSDQYFTLSQIKKSKEIIQVNKGLAQYYDDADALVVSNQEGYNGAGDFCKNIKVAGKKIEEKRKFFVDPYNRVIKEINSIFKGKKADLDEIEKVIKDKMLVWYKAEQVRIEKERIKIEEQNARKLAKQAEKVEANPDKEYIPPVLKSGPAEIDKTAKGIDATSTVKKIWKWELVNDKEVPREYLIVDAKKIGALVKAGLRDIPGIKIYSEDTMSIR